MLMPTETPIVQQFAPTIAMTGTPRCDLWFHTLTQKVSHHMSVGGVVEGVTWLSGGVAVVAGPSPQRRVPLLPSMIYARMIIDILA